MSNGNASNHSEISRKGDSSYVCLRLKGLDLYVKAAPLSAHSEYIEGVLQQQEGRQA